LQGSQLLRYIQPEALLYENREILKWLQYINW